MPTTGTQALERALHKTNEWLSELDEAFGWEDRQRTYHAFRAVTHALRDRLQVEEAVQLAAQLPLVLKGVYFDGWTPTKTPVTMRTQEEFLERVMSEYGGPNASAPDEMTRIVFGLLQRRVTGGEIDDVKASLPAAILELWPTQD